MRKGQSIFRRGNVLVFTESKDDKGYATYFYPEDVATTRFTLYKYPDGRGKASECTIQLCNSDERICLRELTKEDEEMIVELVYGMVRDDTSRKKYKDIPIPRMKKKK